MRYDSTGPGCGYFPQTSIGSGRDTNGQSLCLPSSLYQLHFLLVSLQLYEKYGQSLQFSGRSIINTPFFTLHLLYVNYRDTTQMDTGISVYIHPNPCSMYNSIHLNSHCNFPDNPCKDNHHIVP